MVDEEFFQIAALSSNKGIEPKNAIIAKNRTILRDGLFWF
jgi:hypothetical protein